MGKTNIKQMLTLNDFQNETWYHGTTLSLKGTSIDKFNIDTSYTRKQDNQLKTRRLTDFGRGFYLTNNFKQAERLAKMRLNRRGTNKKLDIIRDYMPKDEAVVLGYKIDFIRSNSNFNKTGVSNYKGIKGLVFNRFDDNYIRYTMIHRLSNYNEYMKKANRYEDMLDFVYGPVLDGVKGKMIYDMLLSYKKNNVSLHELESKLMYRSKEENQLCILKSRMEKYMILKSCKMILT